MPVRVRLLTRRHKKTPTTFGDQGISEYGTGGWTDRASALDGTVPVRIRLLNRRHKKAPTTFR